MESGSSVASSSIIHRTATLFLSRGDKRSQGVKPSWSPQIPSSAPCWSSSTNHIGRVERKKLTSLISSRKERRDIASDNQNGTTNSSPDETDKFTLILCRPTSTTKQASCPSRNLCLYLLGIGTVPPIPDTGTVRISLPRVVVAMLQPLSVYNCLQNMLIWSTRQARKEEGTPSPPPLPHGVVERSRATPGGTSFRGA